MEHKDGFTVHLVSVLSGTDTLREGTAVWCQHVGKKSMRIPIHALAIGSGGSATERV